MYRYVFAFVTTVLLTITVTSANVDPSRWMSQLSVAQKTMPLLNLAIPGSHDSFTETLEIDGPIADDEQYEAILQILEDLLGDRMNEVIRAWSVTQHYNVTQQLSAGIRYFDFRLCHPFRNATSVDEVRICHGLYGDSVWNIIAYMNVWLDAHPTEVVLADWNHFYNYSQKLHHDTKQRLESTFGSKLCPRVNNFTNITLNWTMQHHCQVILCYHDASYVDASWAYPGNAIISPWADTDNLTDLIHYLTDHIHNRPTNAFYVFQGVRTENVQDILLHLESSLLKFLANETTQYISNWLNANRRQYRHIMNIVFADFVDLHGFIGKVLAYNFNPDFDENKAKSDAREMNKTKMHMRL